MAKLDKSAFTSSVLSGYNPGMMSNMTYHPALREGVMTWYDIPPMQTHPTIQIGMRTILAPWPSVKWKVKSNSPAAANFIDSTLRQFWQGDMPRVVEHHYTWGTCPGETNYKFEADRGLMCFDGIDEIFPFDTQARRLGRKVLAFTAPGAYQTVAKGIPWVRHPKMFWSAHKPRVGTPYGVTRLRGAWAPWLEHAGAKGARDARRLWMFKCSFSGGRVYYPPGATFQDANGNAIDNQDFAREIVEKSEMGHVMAMPYIPDEKGNPTWRVEDAKINGQAGDLLQYPKDLDGEILWGMGVFPECVKAMETGSGWSGRQVPLRIFLASTDMDVRVIVTAFDECVLRPLVLFNFGRKVRYQIELVSLLEEPPAPAGVPAGGGKPSEAGPAAAAAQKPEGGGGGGIAGTPPGQDDGPGGIIGGGKGVSMSSIVPTVGSDDGSVPLPDDVLDLILQADAQHPVEDAPVVHHAFLHGIEPVAMSGASLLDKIKAAAELTERNPSEAQRDSGLYRKGRVTVQGLPITIETPKGAMRRGVDADGAPWECEMAGGHYGYIRKTESAADGDHVDVLIGPCPECELVHVVDQIGKDGEFDEAKCCIGFPNEQAAREGYLACYEPGWKCGPITTLTMDQFKHWLSNGSTAKPIAEQVREPVWMSAAHAPKGGVTLKGQHFPGGEFIPANVMAQATPQEKAKVLGQAPPTQKQEKPAPQQHGDGLLYEVSDGKLAQPQEQQPAAPQQAAPKPAQEPNPTDRIPKISEFNAHQRETIFSRASADELNAVHLYQNTPVYRSIQEGLRGMAGGVLGKLYHGVTMSAQAKEAVQHLDNLMERSDLPASTLHRAMIVAGSGKHGADLKSLVGKTIGDPAFTSTSADPEAIEHFMTHADRVRTEIHVPKGAHGLSLHSHATGLKTKWDGEKEILLPRGSKFTVTHVGKDADGRWRVKMELQTQHAGDAHQIDGARTQDRAGRFTWVMHAAEKTAKVAYKAYTAGFRAAHHAVNEVARERGLSDKWAKRLATVMSVADVGLRAAAVVGAEQTAGPMAAALASQIPIASMAYLGYRFSKDPRQTWEAAKTAVKKMVGQTPVQMSGATNHADPRQLAGVLADRAKQLGARFDEWALCFVAAAYETRDLARSIEVADQAFKIMDGQS